MITPAVVNGKGAPAAGIGKSSYVVLCQIEDFIRQGATSKGVAVFEANAPLIRHLVGKKIPLRRPGSSLQTLGRYY